MKKRNYCRILKINSLQKGFTLLELMIALVILAILTALVIAAINPVEQLNKARDRLNEVNAENLLAAIERYQAVNDKKPNLVAVAPSIDCNDIVQVGPVIELEDLKNELTDWFPQQLSEPGKELYTGINQAGRVKVCFKVLSMANIGKSSQIGCNEGYYYFNCLPY